MAWAWRPWLAVAVAVVVAYFTAGAASGAGTTAGNAAAVSAGEGVALAGAGGGTFVTATGATISSVVGGAVTAGISALAGQVAVALINNKGDIGGALDDLGSSASVKGLLTAIVTGGVLGGLNLNPTGLPTSGAGAQGVMTQLGQNLQAAAARAVIGTAINGGSLEDSLKDGIKTAFLDTFAAQTAHGIGQNFPVGEASNYLAHAVAGCAVGAARSSSSAGCGSGAVGAVVGEAAAIAYNAGRNMLTEGLNPDTVQFAGMFGGIAAALAGGDPNIGAAAAGNAAANNFSGAVARGVAACLEISLCRNGVLTAAMAAAISGEIERTRAANPGMSDRAVEAMAVSSVLAQATASGIGSVYGWFTSTPATPLPPTPPMITPAEAQRVYGAPPLQDPEELRAWLGQTLQGYPADEAQKWAQDLIRTLPASEQVHYSDLIVQQVHHICTDKNCVSPNTGGPWTPRFQDMFDKADLSMQDELNKVWVAGHQGPHPQEYHEAVFERLDALRSLPHNEYQKAFKDELNKIGKEIQTPGSYLNKLVTKK